MNAAAVHAVARRSRPKDDAHAMEDRGRAPLRAGDPRGSAAGHACPLGSHDRCDRSARAGRPAADLADPRHAAGLVARRARRPRLAAGRKRRPTAAIIDTQSVKTGPQRGPRGYDAHKKIKGRKRVLLVDTQGDPLGVRVVSADVQDRDALRALAPDLDAHASLLLVWLDRAFAGDDPATFLGAHGVTPELVGSCGRQGFQVEPRRWKVEQTFGCLQRYRRLRVDDEMSHDASRHMTVLASVFMIGMRLQRMLQ